MIRITDPARCCGCTACMAVCPHDAVSMKEDGLGFRYPQVSAEKCVDCGLCEKVCDFAVRSGSRKDFAPSETVDVKAFRYSDPDVLGRSQSGGAFTALSDVVLENGGVVYGAVADGAAYVRHTRTQTKDGRDEMRGSKYIQSDMGNVFRLVKDDLQSGREVMFTGTPCQVAGLNSFLPESLRKNLILVDVVCHGVPSPAVWRDYVHYMGRFGNVVRTCFRDKNLQGWKSHIESFEYDDGTKRTSETFKVLFYKNVMLRHSCGICPYNISERPSDITIADFWGVGEVAPSMDGDTGTSMVICNTAKGKMLYGVASGGAESLDVTLSYDFIIRKNPNLLRPSLIHKDRQKFEHEYVNKGFVRVARRWGDIGLRFRLWKIKKYIMNLLNIR